MSDLKLQMIVTGNNSGLNTMLNDSDARVRKFTTGAMSHFSKLQTHASKVWSAINGASAATKLIGIGAGVGGLKSVIDDNLAFERTLLKMKFNAQLTTKELVELKKQAIELSRTSLNSPLEIVQMQKALANAGLKMPDIRALSPAIANAAQVFEAPADEIANLVFDKITKSGIKNERVPQMLDMLYFHATSGRFETMDMARQAPELLNAGANVGLNNEAGLNLMGAMTQRMMRNATVQNPAEVTTIIKHGLSHITDPHYVKGLAKVGIDVPSYFDGKGHFKGEGGVDGIIALTKAMKEKGLDNPFKMGEAGFKEQYTKTFWLEMMRSLDAKDTDKDPNLLNMITRGKEAANSGQLAANLAVIKEATFGKIKAAEIEIQNAKLSEGAQMVTKAAGGVAGAFADSPYATTAAAAGVILVGNELKKKVFGGRGGKGGLADAVGAATNAGMPVMVTNWPAGLGNPIKASERLSSLPGKVGSVATGAAATATGSAAVLAAVPTAIAVGGAALALAATNATAANREKLVDMGSTAFGGAIGGDYAFAAAIMDVAEKGSAPAAPSKLAQLAQTPGTKANGAPNGAATIDNANTARWKLELAQLDRRINTTKTGGDKELLQKLEKQRTDLVEKLDNVVKELQALNNRPIQVNLDSRPIAAAVNTANGRDARRN
jgi:hypothetical protein